MSPPSGQLRQAFGAFGVGVFLAGAGLLLTACSWTSHSTAGPRHFLVTDRGQLGLVRAGERRARVERRLGPGVVLGRRLSITSASRRVVTRVRYPPIGLDAVFVSFADRPARLLVASTGDSRYRTRSGLGVGSSLKALRDGGLTCTNVEALVGSGTSASCNLGGAYRHPLVAFVVRGGRVARLILAAAAD